MLEKPAIQDETILACLQADYGLPITQVTFLPLGQDRSTAVYQAAAADGAAYFCKLRLGDFDEISVELPKFLREQGVAQVIPPLVTTSGQLWAETGAFHLTLAPFVAGQDGYAVALSERQWAEFGAALKQIHTVELPPALRQKIAAEDYSAEWREKCRQIIRRLDHESFDDPEMAPVLAFLRARRATILDLIARAAALAPVMAERAAPFVLVHSDIHPGNLLIDPPGALFIVDWDRPMLAPKERDLMYIGDGQGFIGHTHEEEEQLFACGYGEPEIDPVALAYYRYERNVMDIYVECSRLFSGTLGVQDKAQSFQILHWYFDPGGSIERAYQSDRTRQY